MAKGQKKVSSDSIRRKQNRQTAIAEIQYQPRLWSRIKIATEEIKAKAGKFGNVKLHVCPNCVGKFTE